MIVLRGPLVAVATSVTDGRRGVLGSLISGLPGQVAVLISEDGGMIRQGHSPEQKVHWVLKLGS